MKKIKSPVIEIHGTSVYNRGAELMAIAISEKINAIYPNAKIVVSSNFGTPADIARYGFITTLSLESPSKQAVFSLLAGIFSGKIVSPNRVHVVLDASGFAFSDQWGARAAKKLFYKMNIMGRSMQPLIFLPQALGKFEKPEVKLWCTKLFNRASIVFSRDTVSYNYAKEIVDIKKLKQCPDFTMTVKPQGNHNIDLPENFVSIVPNIRMLDKLDNKTDYLNFLKKSVDSIRLNNLIPVFIIHDAHEDSLVVEMLGKGYQECLIVRHEDPRVLKDILGQSVFVIGSRFHALVSTLSQGVPCIGAGWSHKYPELFSDFSTKDTLIDDLNNIELLESQIKLLSDTEYRMQKVAQISQAAKNLKAQIDQMWEIVIAEIDSRLQQVS